MPADDDEIQRLIGLFPDNPSYHKEETLDRANALEAAQRLGVSLEEHRKEMEAVLETTEDGSSAAHAALQILDLLQDPKTLANGAVNGALPRPLTLGGGRDDQRVRQEDLGRFAVARELLHTYFTRNTSVLARAGAIGLYKGSGFLVLRAMEKYCRPAKSQTEFEEKQKDFLEAFLVTYIERIGVKAQIIVAYIDFQKIKHEKGFETTEDVSGKLNNEIHIVMSNLAGVVW